jgi:hypothetical protein
MLRLDSLIFQPPHDRPEGGGRLRPVFACVREAGLWLDFDHAGKRGGRPKRFDSEEQLAAASDAWGANLYTVQRGRDERPECYLQLSLGPAGAEVRYSMRGETLERFRDTLLDRFTDLTVCIHEAFHGTARLGPRLGVEIFDPPFPRVRPPRAEGFWTYGNAADFICREFHERSSRGQPEVVRRLLKAPMPAGTRRAEKGDLVILRWATNLSDAEQVARRRTLQEQWYVNVLSPPVGSGYNEAGDYLETPPAAERRPPLTLYDAAGATGYKATALAPDGGVDEELFAEMAEWVRAGRLPDGTPLGQLHLILPNRESALRARARAAAAGVGKVLYADDEGGWWNPFPPGLWHE